MEDLPQKPLRQRRTKDQILQLIDQYEASGLTAAEFCNQHDVQIKKFHKWRSRYKPSQNNHSPSGFASLEVVASEAPGLFAEVKGIKIYQPVSASFLKDLLA